MITKEELEALKEYIDAAIEAKIDNCQSSDAGLQSTVIKNRAEEKLDSIVGRIFSK